MKINEDLGQETHIICFKVLFSQKQPFPGNVEAFRVF